MKLFIASTKGEKINWYFSANFFEKKARIITITGGYLKRVGTIY